MSKRFLALFLLVTVFAFCLSCGGHRHLTTASGLHGNTPDVALPTNGIPQTQTLDEALSDLAKLTPPQGVDEALFTQLKTELERQLKGKSTSKFVSTPPAGEANSIGDLSFVDNGAYEYELHWSYANIGDYNQDGKVGISDITPLAIHFGETTSPSNEWIDGSDDGVINISDITPIAMSFATETAGYLVECSSALDWGWTQVEVSPLLLNSSGDMRTQYSVSITAQDWYFCRVRPYDSGSETGTASNVIMFPHSESGGGYVPPADAFVFPVDFGYKSGYYNATRFQAPVDGEYLHLPSGTFYHLGDDWNGNNGGDTDLRDPVYAVADGTVLVAEYKGYPWGNIVMVKHNLPGEGGIYVVSMYAHLYDINTSAWSVVKKGDIIGRIGKGAKNESGVYAYPAHLHFEMRWGTGDVIGDGYYKIPERGYLGENLQFDPTDFIRNNKNATEGFVLFADTFRSNTPSDNDYTNDPWWYGGSDSGTLARKFPNLTNSSGPAHWYKDAATSQDSGSGCLKHGNPTTYGDNENDSAESCQIFVPLGITNLVMKFDERYVTQAGYDFCHVDVSYNGGQTWLPDVDTPRSGTNAGNPAWSPRTVVLDPERVTESSYITQHGRDIRGGFIKLRFRFTSDSSVSGMYGWQLDNVKVVANGSGSSEPMRPPAAPSGLSAYAISATQISLDWDDNSNNEYEFRVERKKIGALGWDHVADVAANVSHYTNGIILEPNTMYYFRVYAFNAAGCSAYTNEASAKTYQLSTYSITGTLAKDDWYASNHPITLQPGNITVYTDTIGVFNFTNIANGNYVITPGVLVEYSWSPPFKNITINGQKAEGQNFVAVRNTYAVSGTVSKSSGGWLQGVTITLMPGSYSALTDSSGNFTITGVPNGTNYTLTPTLSGWSFNPTSSSVNVSGGNVTGKNFTAIGTPPPNNSPYAPSNPSPSNGTSNVAITTNLTWTGGDPDGDTVYYDVFLGTSGSPPKVSDNQTSTTYNPPSDLLYNTTYYWKIVSEDEHGATTNGSLWSFTTGSEPNNSPYTPSNPSPSNGATDVAITTDLSWSGGDPDGDTVYYDIYFGTSSSPPKVSDNQTSTSYNPPGDLEYNTLYYWKVISEDEHGATTDGPLWHFTTTFEPSTPEWHIFTADSTGDVGTYASLAIVSGNPAISYYDDTNDDLKYVRASNASGTSWGTPITVDNNGSYQGLHTSICLVNGYPAISYYGVAGDLRYVRATDVYGDNWGSPITIDSDGIVGQYTSLAIVNGNPAISYYDMTNSRMKYVRATNANGSLWSAPVIPDNDGSNGFQSSLTVVNGYPAISYYDSGNMHLKYIRAQDTDGSTWGTPITADGSYYVGGYSSLRIVDGNPAISYLDNYNGDLKYVRASNSNGSLWGTPITVDNGPNSGWYTSLYITGGKPAIGYQSADGVRYIQATDVDGVNWSSPTTVDSNGAYITLAIVNGYPAISYASDNGNDLKYAICY